MRDKLNSNPLAQVILIGVLLVFAGFFAISTMGGGGSDAGSTTTATSTTVETPAGTASVTATLTTPTGTSTPVVPTSTGAVPPAPRPLPHSVVAAWSAGSTVVLLFVRDGGIDDRLVKATVERLSSLSGVAIFVVPAGRIARYSAIAQGVDVNRVPALVVLRPKRLDEGIPTASVQYGFQSPESVVQAIVDAGYKGRTVPYHP
ncbi:MAG TPA: hypothetical protein VF176_04835 [Solirubrobacterales bacterium]